MLNSDFTAAAEEGVEIHVPGLRLTGSWKQRALPLVSPVRSLIYAVSHARWFHRYVIAP